MKSGLIAALTCVLVAGCGHDVAPQGAALLPKVDLPETTRQFGVPVLMYHRIADLSEREAKSPLMRDLTVPVREFEQQVKFLAEHGYTFLFTSEVERAVRDGSPLPVKSIAISMDDGYQDNFDSAFPILQKYRAKATIFLVSSTLDTPNHLSWDETRQMRDRSVGFGSHTVHHYDLTSLDANLLDSELADSKLTIEKRLEVPIVDLAYPSGKFDNRVIERVREAGYEAAWKKGGGPVEPNSNQFSLPRVRVHGRTTMADFERKVLSGVRVVEMRRQRAITHLMASL